MPPLQWRTRLLSMLLAVGLAVAGTAAQEPAAGEDAAPTPPTQVVPEPVPQGFNSPSATMQTFLGAMTDERLDDAVECLDLSRVPNQDTDTLAHRLLGVLNRIEVIRSWQLPTATEIDRETSSYHGITEYVFFPSTPAQQRLAQDNDVGPLRIVLARGSDGWWRFSADTVHDIGALYSKLRNLPVKAGLLDEAERSLLLRFERLLPAALVEHTFLTLKYWQWAAILTAIFIGIVIDFALRLVITLVAGRIIARQKGEVTRDTMRRMVRPFGLAAAGGWWLIAVRLIDLPAEALTVLLPAVRFFVMLAGVWAGFRVTDVVSEFLQGKALGTETKFDDLVVPLIRKTFKVFIFIFGLIYIADSLNIPIAPLLTSLGIGGLGFAFAARDTLENFFGSVTVIADRPFQVGDWVVVGDTEGTVETVGFRSSRIRTFYNSLVTIPNGNLVRAVVDNYGQRKYRRWKTHIGITYDTPPDRIDAFCEGIRELIRLHPYTRKDYYQVWMHGFGASSLDVLVYMFHEAPDWTTELRERHRLITDIIRLADQLGVQFAFPTQTLHVFEEAHGQAHQPASPPKAGDRTGADTAGRRAAHRLTSAADWRKEKPGAYRFTSASTIDEDTQIESTTGGDG